MILPATAPVRPDEIRSEIWWPCLFIPSLPSVLKKKKKKKAHTILLFPLSLADGTKAEGGKKHEQRNKPRGKWRTTREVVVKMKDIIFKYEKKRQLFMIWAFFLAWQQNMYDIVRCFKGFKSKEEKRLLIKQTKRKQLVCRFSTVLKKQEHQHTVLWVRNGSKDY